MCALCVQYRPYVHLIKLSWLTFNIFGWNYKLCRGEQNGWTWKMIQSVSTCNAFNLPLGSFPNRMLLWFQIEMEIRKDKVLRSHVCCVHFLTSYTFVRCLKRQLNLVAKIFVKSCKIYIYLVLWACWLFFLSLWV